MKFTKTVLLIKMAVSNLEILLFPWTARLSKIVLTKRLCKHFDSPKKKQLKLSSIEKKMALTCIRISKLISAKNLAKVLDLAWLDDEMAMECLFLTW